MPDNDPRDHSNYDTGPHDKFGGRPQISAAAHQSENAESANAAHDPTQKRTQAPADVNMIPCSAHSAPSSIRAIGVFTPDHTPSRPTDGSGRFVSPLSMRRATARIC